MFNILCLFVSLVFVLLQPLKYYTLGNIYIILTTSEETVDG